MSILVSYAIEAFRLLMGINKFSIYYKRLYAARLSGSISIRHRTFAVLVVIELRRIVIGNCLRAAAPTETVTIANCTCCYHFMTLHSHSQSNQLNLCNFTVSVIWKFSPKKLLYDIICSTGTVPARPISMHSRRSQRTCCMLTAYLA